MSEAAAAARRRADLARNLEAVRRRIAIAALACGRAPESVTLIAVTKTYPADDVALLAGLGVTDIGENREQEAAPKADAMARAGIAVRWHHIGQLQRNKARSVARYASMVHSVDRLPLVEALARARQEIGAAGGVPPLDVLIQVSLDAGVERGGAEHSGAERGGVAPADVLALADAVVAAPALRLAGVMAVAPLAAATAATAAFARLADVSRRLVARHPHAAIISAGMSGDLEEAIAAGATHVRIGSALLGSRPPPR